MIYGQTRRGKTHLTIASEMAAVEVGKRMRVFVTAQLALTPVKANAQGALDPLLADIDRYDLIVLNEFGYAPIDIEGKPGVVRSRPFCSKRTCRSVHFMLAKHTTERTLLSPVAMAVGLQRMHGL